MTSRKKYIMRLVLKFQPRHVNARIQDTRIIDAINHDLDEFNHTKQKKYLVTVSAGTSISYPKDNLPIEDALSLADERMYKIKKKRKKEISNEL